MRHLVLYEDVFRAKDRVITCQVSYVPRHDILLVDSDQNEHVTCLNISAKTRMLMCNRKAQIDQWSFCCEISLCDIIQVYCLLR